MSKSNEDFFIQKSVWAEVKDSLFGCYFKPYVSRILSTTRPLFYVDCFAGKGKFDDGKKGSPLIALDIIDECKIKSNNKYPQIQSCFIELNYAEILNNNISGYKNTQIIHGKYEDHIGTLLQGKEGQNVFLYLDPYGIKALNCQLFDKLTKHNFYSIEILINLNSFGFIREACRVLGMDYIDVESFDEINEYEPSIMDPSEKSKKELTNIAGGEYWIKIIEDYKKRNINGYDAEIQFSREYCKRLQQSYEYVLNMPIRLRKEQRPKYRMIHATKHDGGCVLMHDNIYRRMEVLNRIQTDGQYSIFNETEENMTIDIDEIRDKLEKHIRKFEINIELNKFLAEFYTENGISCSPREMQMMLKDFENKGKIIITRVPAKTKTGKPTKFYTQSTAQAILIRRNL